MCKFSKAGPGQPCAGCINVRPTQVRGCAAVVVLALAALLLEGCSMAQTLPAAPRPFGEVESEERGVVAGVHDTQLDLRTGQVRSVRTRSPTIPLGPLSVAVPISIGGEKRRDVPGEEITVRLRSGGLVAAPTETVYGLAANALDADACEHARQVPRGAEERDAAHLLHHHDRGEQREKLSARHRDRGVVQRDLEGGVEAPVAREELRVRGAEEQQAALFAGQSKLARAFGGKGGKHVEAGRPGSALGGGSVLSPAALAASSAVMGTAPINVSMLAMEAPLKKVRRFRSVPVESFCIGEVG